MRAAAFAIGAVVLAGLALAQSDPSRDTDWRDTLLSLPEHPSANLQDINRFERSMAMAMPYFGTLTPGDYEANRELVRRITVYMVGLDMLYRDPQVSRNPTLRNAIGRARAYASQMRMYPIFVSPAGSQSAPKEPVAAAGNAGGHHEPPFSLIAPTLDKVPPADSKMARELSSLYETDAARSAAAWQSAETLRGNLAAQGMSLNVQTAASVARLQLYFETAATALRERDWAEARTNLERAESETEKIFKTVGR